MSEKSDLIEKCKLLMEDIKQVELDTQAEVRRIYREGEQSIEAEKRRFKLGYEERLTKVYTSYFIIFSLLQHINQYIQCLMYCSSWHKRHKNTEKAQEGH